MNEHTIREATEQDLPLLIELLAQLDPNDPEREEMGPQLMEGYPRALKALQMAGHRPLVCFQDGNLVGSLTLHIVPNLTHRGAPYGIIENMVVDEDHRSRGIGRQLIEHAEGLAREAGCYKLSLTSNKRRKDAHRFYESLGFGRTHEAFRKDLRG
jgi:GNAT superfamily N-acetyltransferase